MRTKRTPLPTLFCVQEMPRRLTLFNNASCTFSVLSFFAIVGEHRHISICHRNETHVYMKRVHCSAASGADTSPASFKCNSESSLRSRR